MEIFRNSSKEIVITKAAKSLNDLLEKNKENPILLLLSGGSAFNLLDNIDSQNLGRHLTITVLDERYSKDEEITNFAQLTKTEFYRKAQKQGCNFIDTRIQDNELLKDLALRFEQELKKWKENNLEGKIIATQGIGPDGHTAGIMPYPENPDLFKELFENKEKWVVGYNAGENKNQYPLRVTTTITFLQDLIDYAIVYVSGEEKREVLTKVLSEKGSLAETPARIIREMKDLKLFTNLV